MRVFDAVAGWVMLLLEGCSCSQDCATIAQPLPIAACFAPEGGWRDLTGRPEGEPYELHLANVEVLQAGRGEPPDDCPLRYSGPAFGRFPADSDFGHSRWLRVEDGETAWTIGVVLAVNDLAFEEGERVSVDFSSSIAGGEGLDVPRSSLLVTNENGKTIYVGQGDSPDDLTTPESTTLRPGSSVCESFDDTVSCYSVSKYELLVRSAEGEDVRLPYGGMAAVGELTFMTGQAIRDNCEPDCECLDRNANNVVVAAVADGTP